jgi:ribosomal protein S18
MLFTVGWESKSFFTPSININMFNASIPHDLNDRLKQIILSEEPNILKNIPPANPQDPDWMTGRLWNYNFLDLNYDEVRTLKNWINEQYKIYTKSIGAPEEKVYIQCWINIIRNNGRRIVPHHHADGHSSDNNAPQEYSYLSGNLCVQTKNTSTWFRSPFLDKHVCPIKNINGEMILFPSWLVHWTDVNESEEPRITVSFDIIKEEFYNLIDGHNYIELE